MPLSYPSEPKTVGEHIKKRRMDLKMVQTEVALLFGISNDCVTNWENNYKEPQIQYFPQIIKFLGYCPVDFDETTFAGKLKAYRLRNGLSNKKLGNILKLSGSTILDWESETCVPNQENLKKMEAFLEENH